MAFQKGIVFFSLGIITFYSWRNHITRNSDPEYYCGRNDLLPVISCQTLEAEKIKRLTHAIETSKIAPKIFMLSCLNLDSGLFYNPAKHQTPAKSLALKRLKIDTLKNKRIKTFLASGTNQRYNPLQRI